VFKTIFQSPRALFYAILVHIVLFAILTVSINWTSEPEKPVTPAVIVKATAVDESKIQAEVNKLKKAEQDRIRKEQEHQKQLDREAELARKKREAEEKRLAELEKKRQLEKQQLDQEKLRKQQELQAQEKKLKELDKKRQAQEQQLAKAQAEKQRLEQETKQRKIAEEKRRQAEEEEMMRKAMAAEEQALLKDQMAAEQAKLNAENEKRAQSEIQQYIGLIRQKVERNWLKPASAKAGMSCEVFVRLIPGGGVSHVEITQSSGDGFFDSSVEKAVRKAEPLPVPPDPDLFDRFRDVKFIFKPEA